MRKPTPDSVKIALVLTVLNEGQHIRRLFDSICAQTRPPDEVIVCDGGSQDDTLKVIEAYSDRLPLRIVAAPGANISTGRNCAIRAATSEVIAVTDAGVRLAPDWLQMLVQPFEAEVDAPVLVAGFFLPDPQTTFEVAMGVTVLPQIAEIDPAKFLPSSRSAAFRKAAWEAVGGYPEWLDYSEDVVFDLLVREQFGAFAFVPEAIVHFRPRGSLGAFARQYFNYARGDGRAGLFPLLHLIRYFTYLIALPLGLYAALFVNPWMWLVGGLAGLAYVRRPLLRLRRYSQTLTWMQRVQVLVLIPILRVVGDVAKMVGYPPGVWQRVVSPPPQAPAP